MVISNHAIGKEIIISMYMRLVAGKERSEGEGTLPKQNRRKKGPPSQQPSKSVGWSEVVFVNVRVIVSTGLVEVSKEASCAPARNSSSV